MPPLAARPLDPMGLPAARRLAERVGAHGVYLGNALATWSTGGDLLGLHEAEELVGLAFFGRRGNLILAENKPLEGDTVARHVRASGLAWRIALGPEATIAALARQEVRPPLVERTQIYYGMTPREVADDCLRDDVRLARRGDQALLLKAALDLNEVDLSVDRRRVHKQWLRESIERRVREQQTLVIDQDGKLACKLDIGSRGPHGLVVEGVYTFPKHRGRGLAAGLVATVAHREADAPLVCLHVDGANTPARRAYERAGMRELGCCGLVLRS